MATEYTGYPHGETLAEILERLARKGVAEGLGPRRALRCAAAYTVPSSHPEGGSYCVIVQGGHQLHGCDCEGYGKHGYCKHYALAIAAEWGLPDVDDEIHDLIVEGFVRCDCYRGHTGDDGGDVRVCGRCQGTNWRRRPARRVVRTAAPAAA